MKHQLVDCLFCKEGKAENNLIPLRIGITQFGADKDYSTGEKQAYSLYQNAWKDTYAGNYKAALQAFKKSSCEKKY